MVGVAWVTSTLAFEFGLGHYDEHKPWDVLVADYDFTSGRIWLLIPIWVAIGSAIARRRRVRQSVASGTDHAAV